MQACDKARQTRTSDTTEFRVVILAGENRRAGAYVRAAASVGFDITGAVIYGPPAPVEREPLPDSADPRWDPLPNTLRGDWDADLVSLQTRVPCTRIFVSDLSDPEVAVALDGMQPDLVLYSGLAGGIVPGALLRRWAFLHVHPGRLPHYRGSTTIYWSLLQRNRVECSAILLSDEIDHGRVVGEYLCPDPTSSSDIDVIYDCGVRAMALAKVLANIGDNGIIGHEQTEAARRDFFVIHPVLKNVVIERLQRGDSVSGAEDEGLVG